MTIRGERRIPFLVAVVMVAFFAALVARGQIVDSKADHLCRALATVVGEGDLALDSIDYYRQPQHKDELADAHAANRRLLDLIDCKPLPKIGDTQ